VGDLPFQVRDLMSEVAGLCEIGVVGTQIGWFQLVKETYVFLNPGYPAVFKPDFLGLKMTDITAQTYLNYMIKHK